MRTRALDLFDHDRERFLERGITSGTAEPSVLREILIIHAALFADQRRFLARTAASFFEPGDPGQQVAEIKVGLEFRAFFFGAGLANVDLGHLVVHDLGQMDSRFFSPADVTDHRIDSLSF